MVFFLPIEFWWGEELGGDDMKVMGFPTRFPEKKGRLLRKALFSGGR